jgi:hypothetical protein
MTSRRFESCPLRSTTVVKMTTFSPLSRGSWCPVASPSRFAGDVPEQALRGYLQGRGSREAPAPAAPRAASQVTQRED